METLSTKYKGEWYKVFFHPDVTKFMIIKHHNDQYPVLQDSYGRWCSSKGEPLKLDLPIDNFYDQVLQYLRTGYKTTTGAAIPGRN